MLEREWEGECVDFRKSVRMLGGDGWGFFFWLRTGWNMRGFEWSERKGCGYVM